MSNTIMTAVYNHYMTSYAPKRSDARLDSHNKNELKNIYGRILKLNKEAPLYIYDQSPQTTDFALSLKENTRQLQHSILVSGGNKEQDFLENKVAFSSDEETVSVKYIGESLPSDQEPASCEIIVHNLASGQINTGNFLPSDESDFPEGTYTFDVRSNNFTYEFQFTAESKDTNFEIQSRLARMLNHANLGLKACVISGDEFCTALEISSLQTGETAADGSPLFEILSDSSFDFLNHLGLNQVTSKSSNANFTINGESVSTASNQFTIDDTYEVTLLNISSAPQTPVTIGVKTNIDSIKDNVHNLISGYNTFLEAVDQYRHITSSNKLNYEVQSIARVYQNQLNAVGITITGSGALSVDENLLTQTAQSEEAEELLSPLKEFSTSLFTKGDEISRDPLNYANKKMVAYKNPGKNFPSPYASSSYSGLLFNSYC